MTDELLEADPEVEKTWMAGALLGKLGVPDDFKAAETLVGAAGLWNCYRAPTTVTIGKTLSV